MTQRAKWAALAAVAAAILGAVFGPVLGNAAPDEEPPDTVMVAASGSVELDPDIAEVSLGIRVLEPTAEQASDELTDRANAVLDALEGIGYSDDQVDTFGVKLFAKEDRDDNLIGYVGSAGIRVETEDLDDIGNIIDVGVDAGANNVRGVSFNVKDRTEAVKQALQEAMQFAQAKANTLATEGNRQLGMALDIDEHGTRPPRSAPAASARLAFGSGGQAGGNEPNPFPIEPPMIKVTATVTVTFQLN